MTQPAALTAILVLPWLAVVVAPLLGRASHAGRIIAMAAMLTVLWLTT